MTEPKSSHHLRVIVPDADAMVDLGRRLAGTLTVGDLVILTGELGAGKTTLSRGIGEGLNIRGPVTSPTFVIAREHPSLADGPRLVHVDAYRLRDAGEIDDLDLETALTDSVVLAEWGHGKVEHLSESRVSINIERTSELDSDRRVVQIGTTDDRDMSSLTTMPGVEHDGRFDNDHERVTP